MFLLRLILIFLICYLVLSALRSASSGGKIRPPRRRKSTGESEDMVFDPQCQSYVPKADAVLESGKYFCSRECARLYLSR